jgi:hypothetical protein
MFKKKDVFYAYDLNNDNCNCVSFSKWKICKHQLTIKIKQNKVDVPEKFSIEPVK